MPVRRAARRGVVPPPAAAKGRNGAASLYCRVQRSQMTFPGPPALGRGIITGTDGAVSAEISGIVASWERIRIDDTLVAGDNHLASASRLPAVIDSLHRAWGARRPVVVELDASGETLRRLRCPGTEHRLPHEVGAEFVMLTDRLQFLLWRNNYDARSGTPIWWWTRKAIALGARAGADTDVILPDGAEAWIDGGPRRLLGLPVVHAESVQLGRLAVQPQPRSQGARGLSELAADQRAAAEHGSGPIRVVAPAGSGKTRTLIARLLHLVDAAAIEPSIITAVAYNNRAAAEMRDRLGRSDLQIRTIHSLGWAIVRDKRPNVALITERDVRDRLGRFVTHNPRSSSDTVGPYIEALSDVRIALRVPEAIQADRHDVPQFVDVFDRYRATLAERDECDHDEQVYEAIRLLLADPALRERWQRRCQHLLVDEFQDLTPAYLLLLRLLASPALNVFAVGDDDQTIYGYTGADPGFLVDYDRRFPGAASTTLEVCYRCPPEIVDAAKRLLSNNTRRLEKLVRAGGPSRPGAFQIIRTAEPRMAEALAETVATWRSQGVADEHIAVLARVNAMLLPALAALTAAAVPSTCTLGPGFMARTLIRATLAWTRLALRPDAMAPADVLDAVRRPARKLNRIAAERVTGAAPLTLNKLNTLGSNLRGQWATSWAGFVSDIGSAARCARRGDTVALLDYLTTRVGLLGAADILDTSRMRPDRASHAHDLAALRRTAAVYRHPSTFEERLHDLLSRASPAPGGGVVLATVHRVKGMEWRRVVVFGVDEGILPHQLSGDIEEERRVLHVAITRASEQVTLIGDSQHPSPFLAELDKAPRQRRRGRAAALLRGPVRPNTNTTLGRPERRPATPTPTRSTGTDLLGSLQRWRTGAAHHHCVRDDQVVPDASLEMIARRKPSNEWDLMAIAGVGAPKAALYGSAILNVIREHRNRVWSPPFVR